MQKWHCHHHNLIWSVFNASVTCKAKTHVYSCFPQPYLSTKLFSLVFLVYNFHTNGIIQYLVFMIILSGYSFFFSQESSIIYHISATNRSRMWKTCWLEMFKHLSQESLFSKPLAQKTLTENNEDRDIALYWEHLQVS